MYRPYDGPWLGRGPFVFSKSDHTHTHMHASLPLHLRHSVPPYLPLSTKTQAPSPGARGLDYPVWGTLTSQVLLSVPPPHTFSPFPLFLRHAISPPSPPEQSRDTEGEDTNRKTTIQIDGRVGMTFHFVFSGFGYPKSGPSRAGCPGWEPPCLLTRS